MTSALPIFLLIGQSSKAQPSNDNFAQASTLISPSSITADNSTATSEPGEPIHDPLVNGQSLWWKWIAPSNGVVFINCYSDYGTVINVYTGSALTNLIFVAGNFSPWGPSSICYLHGFHAGQTYYFDFDGWNGVSGPFEFYFEEQPAPVNDDFAQRTLLQGLPVSAEPVSQFAATSEPGEPVHPDQYFPGTVWWTWTSPITGKIGATNAGGIIPGFAFYTGSSLPNLTLVAGGQTWPSGTVTVDVQQGQTYQIAGYSAQNQQGGFGLQLVEAQPPVNDLFANATPLFGTNIVLRADNIYADIEPGEPQQIPSESRHSVWWSWTAPDDGELTVQISPDNGAFETALFVGNSLETLRSLGHSTNEFNYPFVTSVRKGVTYRLAADGVHGYYGTFGLSLEFAPTSFPPLALSIASADNRVTIGWPEPAGGAVLESCTNLGALWQPVTNSVMQVNGTNITTISEPQTQRQAFYRLRF